MEARIRFSCEIFIEGTTKDDILEKFESLPLFSAEALEHFADFVQYELMTDTDTNEEIEM